MEPIQDYTLLENAIREAGIRAQEIRKTGLSVTQKGRQDFVSQADLFVESELRKTILSLYPDDDFLGEESGLTKANNTLDGNGVWVIDPIDGTTNYLQKMDYWCLSIAYVVAGEIQLGFIYAPDRDEFFVAKRDKGAFLNNQRLTIQEPESGQAIIGLGRSNRRPLKNYLDVLHLLDQHNVEYRRFGSGALMLAHVASGQVNGYFEAHLNSWDALAGLLLIEEAGGRVPNFLTNNGLLEGNSVWTASKTLWEELNTPLAELSHCL